MFCRIIKVFILLIIICILFISAFIAIFFTEQKKVISSIPQCIKTEEGTKEYNKCYKKIFTYLLIPKVLIYKYKTKSPDRSMDNMLIRLDLSSRLHSYFALSESDVIMGYGVWYNMPIEDNFSLLFDKPAYAFDCSSDFDDENINSKKAKFYRECIGTDKFVLKNLFSSGKVHLFGDKVKELNLSDKKIFLKLEISGAELEVLPDILKNANQITGISVIFHPDNIDMLNKMIECVDLINKDFILVARNTIISNWLQDAVSLNSFIYKGRILRHSYVLSYVNKNILDSYDVSLNQNTKKLYKNYKYYYFCKNERDIESGYPYCGEAKDFMNSCLRTNKKMPDSNRYCTVPIENNNVNVIIPLIERFKRTFNYTS